MTLEGTDIAEGSPPLGPDFQHRLSREGKYPSFSFLFSNGPRPKIRGASYPVATEAADGRRSETPSQ